MMISINEICKVTQKVLLKLSPIGHLEKVLVPQLATFRALNNRTSCCIAQVTCRGFQLLIVMSLLIYFLFFMSAFFRRSLLKVLGKQLLFSFMCCLSKAARDHLEIKQNLQIYSIILSYMSFKRVRLQWEESSVVIPVTLLSPPHLRFVVLIHHQRPYDPTTTKSMKTLLKNRLHIL